MAPKSLKHGSATRVKAPPRSRQRTFQVGDRVRANAHAPGDYRDRSGFITELGPGTSEYRVEFDDGQQPTTGYLIAASLDAAMR